MEKDILIKSLKEKVGEDNRKIISDRTFDGIAESVLPMFADDAAISEETWKLPVAALIQFAGQKRFDEKNFTEKYKADYAKEYAEQHEKNVEERIRLATEKAIEDFKNKQKNTVEPDDDIDTKVQKAVSEAFKGLTGADGEIGKTLATISSFVKNQEEREKTAQEQKVRSELTDYLKSRKADKEAVIELTVSQLEIGKDAKLAELKVLAEKNYESNYKKFYGDGGQPFGGNGGEGGKGSSFVKAAIEKLKSEADSNKNYATEQEKTFC